MYAKPSKAARIQCCKYRVAPDMAMTGLRTMILPYGAGGEPGRGETPMRLCNTQSLDDFLSRRGC